MEPSPQVSGLVGPPAITTDHVAAIYTPGLRGVLHLTHVTSRQWLVSLALALSILFVSEVHKVVLRRGAARRVHA